MQQPQADATWLGEHPEIERRYAGEWILIEDRRVIAHDTDIAVVLKVAESHPDALLAQAHEDEGLIL